MDNKNDQVGAQPVAKPGYFRRFVPTGIIATFAIMVAVLLVFALVVVWKNLPENSLKEQRQPLYWVSQMDPNYRSAAPGKCPHGMDLVPVYAEDLNRSTASSGVVEITPAIQQQMGVRTASAQLGQLRLTLRAYGRVVPDAERVLTLSPRVKGFIDILFVHADGELVKRGQPLFALYSPELVQAQDRFLEAVKSQKAIAISRAEAELRALNLDDLAIDQLRREGVPQRSVIFRAPKDGMVDMLNIKEGDYVRPKDSLLVVGSMESVWLELELFESQAGQIKPRQPLTFTTPAHPGLVWEGEIDSLYPDLDLKAKTLRFRSVIDNSRMLLRPNMQIEALIALPKREPALLIPRSAVIDLGDRQRVVMQTDAGHFKSVAVSLGEGDHEQVEILQGLKAGDRVVTSAHFLIDSESSKTSDLLRMEPIEETTTGHPATWVEATILKIQPEQRLLRLQHERITAWKMPAMTMNFDVAEGVDMRLLKLNQRVQVQIADGEPRFKVMAIKPGRADKTE